MGARGCLAVAITLVLDACATAPKMTWIRTDGQEMADNAALKQQFVVDSTVCTGERQKADLSGTTFANGSLAAAFAAADRANSADAVLKGCMAQHGYLLVEVDKAPSISAQFAATHQPAAPQSAAKAGAMAKLNAGSRPAQVAPKPIAASPPPAAAPPDTE
jgi:hypothetical protein